ncbi:MAG: CaiB/BaiF CoA transferase family protein [Myxococcota bacterium]
MLSACRVLDLADERGLLCGQILADMGADVIAVEPPGGCSARRIGPWLEGERGLERSLFWWAYARNKRSVVLDVESRDDLEILRRLAAGADFWIESDAPGRLATLGLGYSDLAKLNPALIYVSITPFGQDGPKAAWAASDLTQMAAGGQAYLSGEAERPPVRIRVPQAHAHAAADAAVGALLAHAERRHTGRGQHVDVSTQQSVTLATMYRSLDQPVGQVPAQRVSGGVQAGEAFVRTRYELRDGFVVLGAAFLPSTGHFMVRLLRWAGEEGYDVSRLLEEDWNTFGLRLVTGQLFGDAYDETDALLTSFFRTRTKREVMRAAVERKLLLAPVLELDEIIDSEQLASRDFGVEHAEPATGHRVRFPGPFARFEASPLRYRLPPPRLDEHGDDIRREAPRRPPAVEAPAPERAPLQGVRILDLFWVLAGPAGTRMLADYGATVVRVESMRRLDTLRVIPPYQFSQPHPEGAIGFQAANANKLGLTLDLASPEGREVALDLVRWADVVTESFAPGVMESYGLGWETLRALKPDLIMVSSCLMGQTGPWREFTGFGNLAASVTGFQQLASWPGRPPSGPFGAYTDFVAARYNALAILGALEVRARSGRGQHIDQSQAESALHFIAPAYLDWTVNGHAQGAAGNHDGELFPHGMFPASGEDRWVAIAVASERQWRALCRTLGRPDLIERRAEREGVDEAIAEWTRKREAEGIEASLQAAGVPCHVALDTPGLHADPQLQHRGHYLEIEHSIYPTTTIEDSRLRMSRARPRLPRSALHFGRDNRYVLETLLGYPPERIGELAERGVLW